MARKPREPKSKTPPTHAEKLARSVRDTKDLLVLFVLLLVILGVWDLWFVNEVADLQSEADKRAEVRRHLDEVVEPKFARRALERQSNRTVSGDLRERVLDFVDRLNIKFEQGGKIVKGRKDVRIRPVDTEQRDDITRVETVELERIRQIEMWRLIELLIELKNRSNRNTWCTHIEGLTPLRDEEGFSLVTTKNDPVYDIKSLRIARFTEIKNQP